MGKNERHLEDNNKIYGSHTDEAAGYEHKKQPALRFVALTAVLIVLAAAFAMSRSIKRRTFNQTVLPAETNEAARTETPSETPSDTEHAEPQPTEGPRVVYAPSVELITGSVPKPGEARISRALSLAMEDESNKDCLFAVIVTGYPIEASAAYIREYEAALYSDPIYVEFMAEYETWEPTYELTEEEQALVDGGELRSTITWERFLELWKAEKPAESVAELDEIMNRIGVWRSNLTGLYEYRELCAAEERARLEGAGYTITLNEYGKWCSKLTAEQIRNFPADPGWGYDITWDNGRDRFING